MTPPYHATSTTTLYHGDALEILPTFATGTAHAVITDPPYALAASSGRGGTWPDMMNAATWYTLWFREVLRILRPDGAFWLLCNWKTLPIVMRAASDANQPISAVAVWDKRYIGTGSILRSRYELCVLMARPKFRILDRGAPDVWEIPTSSQKPHGHPAEKPERLIDHILDLTRIPLDGLVVDPFAGSGTTLAAVAARGQCAMGIEANDHWFGVASQRLAAIQPQLPTTSKETDQ